VYLDVVGGKGALPTTHNGNKYILTFQDDLSKFSEAIAIPNQEADTIAKAFISRIILKHGPPVSLLTDQGTNFLSNLFKSVCKFLKIKKVQTCAFTPRSNGQLEKSHRGLAEYLRHYVNADQTNWDEWLDYATFTYNTTPHSTTGLTPFELIYGRKADLPSAVRREPQPMYNFEDYVSELRFRLQASHAIARQSIKTKKEISKRYYDKNAKPVQFNVGDLVLLKKVNKENKLSSLYEGPYKISDINSPENSTIVMKRRSVRVNNNRLIKYETREDDV
jgi:hypothetical protein